jgi:predicted nucleic acid-binding protein
VTVSGTGATRNVAVDATVLINLIQAGRLDILGALEGWRFVVPDQVVEEVSHSEQAAVLERAFEAGLVHRESSTDPGEIAIYAELRLRMGKGEAACLAIAATRGWALASDDRGRAFRRLVRERIGEGRLIDTPEIVRIAHRDGVVSEDEADQIRARSRE